MRPAHQATAATALVPMGVPVIETLRGLLTGTPIGTSAVAAVAWCAGLTLVGYLWSRALFDRGPAR